MVTGVVLEVVKGVVTGVVLEVVTGVVTGVLEAREDEEVVAVLGQRMAPLVSTSHFFLIILSCAPMV